MMRKLILTCLAAAAVAGCNQAADQGAEAPGAESAAISTEAQETTPSGLKYTVLQESAPAARCPVATSFAFA